MENVCQMACECGKKVTRRGPSLKDLCFTFLKTSVIPFDVTKKNGPVVTLSAARVLVVINMNGSLAVAQAFLMYSIPGSQELS